MTTTSIAPNALVEGAPRAPLPYGLFSVLSPRGEGDGRWQNGATWESLPCEPATGRGRPYCDPDEPVIGIPKQFDVHNETQQADPFTVIGTFKCSPVGWGGGAAQDRATLHLTTREEARVEQAIWTGDLGNTPNFQDDGVLITVSVLPLALAIARLEGYIAQNYGSLGVIHMPRVVATVALSERLLETRGGRLFTLLGTPVVAGTGYRGVGPDGVQPGVNQSFIYATPALFGYRSDIITSSNVPGDLLDKARNDLYAVAERTYLVGWDDCGVGAVLVGLPAAAPAGSSTPPDDEPPDDDIPLVLVLGTIPSSPVEDDQDVTVVVQANVPPTDDVFLWYQINDGAIVGAGEMTQTTPQEYVFNADESLAGPGDVVEAWANTLYAGDEVESNHITIQVQATIVDDTSEPALEVPDETWTHAQIDAWAADPDHPVDLAGTSTKAEKIAAITAIHPAEPSEE